MVLVLDGTVAVSTDDTCLSQAMPYESLGLNFIPSDLLRLTRMCSV